MAQPESSRDDERLAEDLLAGSDAAATELRAWVERAALPFRARLATEWSDLVQELLIELIEELKRSRWSGSGSLRAFVGRAVAHSCIDRVRHHQRWRMVSHESLPERAAGFQGLERFLDLRRLARRLPEECRRLWGYLFEGLSYEEMSERVGVRAGTLRVRVLRCRERARELAVDRVAGGAADRLAES